jgi:autotransporter translocation and assembly factor TamB
VRGGRIAGADILAQAEGEVTWGERREAAFRVEGDLTSDLFVRLGYVTDQVSGGFHVAGDLHWTPQDWGYRGDVTAEAVRLLDRDLTGLRGEVSGDGRELAFQLAGASYRGGTVRGSLHVDLASAARPTRLDLQVEGADAAGALADQSIPVEAVAGAVRGTVAYRFDFTAPEKGSGEIDLLVAGREQPGRLPISGTVPLRVEKGVLLGESLRLDAPGQQLTAAGSYDIAARRGRFEWSLETEDPAGLAVLLPPQDPGQGPRLWWPTQGAGVISGTLEVGGQGTEAALELALENVRSPGASGERLEGVLRIGERAVEELDLRLRSGASTLGVRGRVPLGSGAAAAGLDIAVAADGWDLADVRAWLPEEVAALRLDGAFTGELSLSGSTELPAGRVSGELRQAALGALELGSLRAAFTFDADAVGVQSAVLAMPAGEVHAAGTIGLRGGPLAVSLRAPALRLGASPFSDLLGGELDGKVAVDAALRGTLERPRGEVRLVQSELTLAGRALSQGEAAELRLDWDGQELRVDGSLAGLVAVDGGGALDLEHADLRFAVASDQLRTLADAAVEAALPEFTGSFVGELGIEGRFAATVRAALRLERLEIGFRGHSLRNLEPVQARLDGDGIVVDSLYLGEDQSELFLAGRVGLSGERPLDLKLQASLPSSWLELVAPSLRASGSFDALATIRGTAERPEVNGEGGVHDAHLIVLGFPHAFEELRATLLFYPDAVVLDGLSTRLGGGLLQASGRVELPAGRAFTYRFQATARDVTLRYPEGWLVRGGGDLTLASTEGGRQVSGALDLDRAYYLRDLQVGLVQLLRSLLARQRVQLAATDEVLSTTLLNVALRIPGGLRVRNNLANLRGSADLLARGSLARPVVFGRVEMERGGTVVYAENEYKVERAILSFANPYRIEPVLDLVAKTEVSSYQVTLNLNGPLDRLRATFASDPPIPDLEVLSLLATGDPGRLAGELTPEPGASASQGAEAFLAGQAASLIGQRVGTLFGLDKFRVAPLAAGGDVVSSVRLTVGKRLRRNLLLTYSVDPSATQDQFLTVEWRLGQNLALLFTQNGDGSYAVDAKWEKAF